MLSLPPHTYVARSPSSLLPFGIRKLEIPCQMLGLQADGLHVPSAAGMANGDSLILIADGCQVPAFYDHVRPRPTTGAHDSNPASFSPSYRPPTQLLRLLLENLDSKNPDDSHTLQPSPSRAKPSSSSSRVSLVVVLRPDAPGSPESLPAPEPAFRALA
ncbi:hypothetical protein ACG7TL_003159 [Trametes sanguinea]